MTTLNAKTREAWTVARMTEAIVATIARADAQQLHDGMAWYPEAMALCQRIADRTGHEPEQVAGMLAALSPRVQWSVNVSMTWAMAETGTCPGLTRSRESAQRIATGDSWQDVLRGPKVRAFAVAVMSGGRAGRAVVDAWAVRAATDGLYDAVAPCRYDDVAEAYRLAAERLGMTVHGTQAVAWVVTRGGAK